MTRQPHLPNGAAESRHQEPPSRRCRVRRRDRILGTAREIQGDLASALTDVPHQHLDAADQIRRILRTYSVQRASMQHSPWWPVYSVIRIFTAALMVVAPVGLLAPLYLTLPRTSQLIAVAAYLAFLVALATGWRFRQGVVYWPRTIIVWCALVLLIGVADVVGPRSWSIQDGSALWLAGLGTAVALALVAVRFWTILWLRERYLRPWSCRVGGGPLPAHVVTVRLLILISSLHQARFSWWNPRTRGHLLQWMAEFKASAARQLRGSARDAGLSVAASEQIERRARHFNGFLQQIENRLLDADSPHDFNKIMADLTAAFHAVACGDWSPLTMADEPPANPDRWLALVRRAIPAIVLVVSALALPNLPGHPPNGDPAIATLQLGLFIAASLSLLPIDADVRTRVINAYTGAGKIAP